MSDPDYLIILRGVPKGIRTPVTAVRVRILFTKTASLSAKPLKQGLSH